jgi:hypothetical protein
MRGLIRTRRSSPGCEDFCPFWHREGDQIQLRLAAADLSYRPSCQPVKRHPLNKGQKQERRDTNATRRLNVTGS